MFIVPAIAAKDALEEDPLDFDFDESALAVGGFQCLKAVHILHGLPSDPRTIPGGSFWASCLT